MVVSFWGEVLQQGSMHHAQLESNIPSLYVSSGDLYYLEGGREGLSNNASLLQLSELRQVSFKQQ